MIQQQLPPSEVQAPTQSVDQEVGETQEFGSNAAMGADLVGLWSGETCDPDREPLLAQARIKLSTFAQLQAEGVRRFERDSLLQDPPPYVDAELLRYMQSALNLAFELTGDLLLPSAPGAKGLVKWMLGELKAYGEGFLPQLATPASGNLDAEVLESMVDAWSTATIAAWSLAQCEFEMQQSALDVEALLSLLDALDCGLPGAAGAAHAACIGGWVNYCASAQGAKDGTGSLDPSMLAVVRVFTSSAAPPYLTGLDSMPAVGTSLPEEMMQYSPRNLGVRTRLTDYQGLDLVVGADGSVLEQRSDVQGRWFLACLGSGNYEGWRPGQVPGAAGPAHVRIGAELLANAILGRTFGEIAASSGWQ